MFVFNLSHVGSTELTHYAEIHVNRVLRHNTARFTISVKSRGKTGQSRATTSERYAKKSAAFPDYLSFDVSDMIANTSRKFHSNKVRFIEIAISQADEKKHKRHNHNVSSSQQQKRIIDSGHRHSNGILLLFSRDREFTRDFKRRISTAMTRNSSTPRVRHKRDISRRRRDNNRFCGLEDMWVDFRTLGWDRWIVYPPRYNAHACSGRCVSPVDWRFDPTNHAVMQSLMRLHDAAIRRPCCVPTKLEPLSMLYIEKDDVVVRHHKGMVASKCACR